MLYRFAKSLIVFLLFLIVSQQVRAHNGAVAAAYPLPVIKLDGSLADWPSTVSKNWIKFSMSDTKPKNAADLSGYFQVGYRLAEKSLYVAFTITDDSYREDTSKNVTWNTQDGIELCIDALHKAEGSAVASLLYSSHFKNINKSAFDPFGKDASWEKVQVRMTRKGNNRYYEWKIDLGDLLVVGKSIGLDFQVFDLDKDSTFTFSSWALGEEKYRNPRALGDILILPANQPLGTVKGKLKWDRELKSPLPASVKLTGTDSELWLSAPVDSLGNYSVQVPAGTYSVKLNDKYFESKGILYGGAGTDPVKVTAKAGATASAAVLVVNGIPAPDLIPEKGILHSFTQADEAKVDEFITTYQDYFRIPGVSMALIKDGKVVYHKTYGVRNTITQQPVDDETLFEAASVTKPVFAFAVQRLAEKGVIDLNKPLYEYLPYEDIADDERYKLITAKHVLTHRTGFPNWRDGKLKLIANPGEKFGYSGEGFEYLKIVVEKITGKKVEQVLKEEVIEPIGLYHTFFSKNDSLKRMVADGHIEGLPNYDELNDVPGMAWSMRTEAVIFTRFMLYLLEQKGLSAQTYENMFSKQTEYPVDPNDTTRRAPEYMGMSLNIRETPFGKAFGHGGNNGDFKCMFEVYKDAKMGYVFFTNSNTSDKLIDVFKQFVIDGKK